jgi:DNA ligase (NAD+)
MYRYARVIWLAREAYYYGDGSPLSDAEYDDTEHRLAELETRYPHLVTYRSPIDIVGVPADLDPYNP